MTVCELSLIQQRCHCSTDNSRAAQRRAELLMGRQVCMLRNPHAAIYLSADVMTHPCVSAYLLASASLSSFYGKISDLVGRKAVLYPVIVLFLVRSEMHRSIRRGY